MAKTDASNPVTKLPARRRRCPICSKPVTAVHQPFCSARCRDIDLGRWLKESYRVATEEPPEEEPEEGDKP